MAHFCAICSCHFLDANDLVACPLSGAQESRSDRGSRQCEEDEVSNDLILAESEMTIPTTRCYRDARRSLRMSDEHEPRSVMCLHESTFDQHPDEQKMACSYRDVLLIDMTLWMVRYEKTGDFFSSESCVIKLRNQAMLVLYELMKAPECLVSSENLYAVLNPTVKMRGEANQRRHDKNIVEKSVQDIKAAFVSRNVPVTVEAVYGKGYRILHREHERHCALTEG